MFVGFVIGFVCGFYLLAGVVLLMIFIDHRVRNYDLLVENLVHMFDISEETAKNIVKEHQ